MTNIENFLRSCVSYAPELSLAAALSFYDEFTGSTELSTLEGRLSWVRRNGDAERRIMTIKNLRSAAAAQGITLSLVDSKRAVDLIFPPAPVAPYVPEYSYSDRYQDEQEDYQDMPF